MARGSLYEVDTQLMVARDLGYSLSEPYPQIKAALDECERILAGLIRSVDSGATIIGPEECRGSPLIEAGGHYRPR